MCSFGEVFVALLSPVFFFKQKTVYEMRISDWSSDVCSSDLQVEGGAADRSLPLLPRPDDLWHAGRRGRHDRRTGGGGPQRPSRQIGSASCRERVCQYV